MGSEAPVSQDPPPDPPKEPQPVTCCPIRRKVVVGILSVLPEEACGVPDSELADVIRFDLASPAGRPVIAFRYCPWCGKPRGAEDELRIVDIHIQPAEGEEDEEGEDRERPSDEQEEEDR